MPRNRTRKTLPDRFWPKVTKANGCWLWTGVTTAFGHGLINEGGHSGKTLRAHRVSWEMHFGSIPKGLYVCHHCDVPACVNPDHLFLGTHAENMADCSAKNRVDRIHRPKGERHGMSRLTEADVRRMLNDYAAAPESYAAIGRRYGVSLQQVFRVLHRQAWAHVQITDSHP